jgi:hypothetical protein
MTDSFKKLWLKGKAEEDIYIAKHEREMRKKKSRKRREDSDRKTLEQDKR